MENWRTWRKSVVEVKIYAEGGGEGQLLDTLFRQGWRDFFVSAGLATKLPRVIRGKGRLRTFDLFRTAIENREPGTLPLLLVDSEDPVDPRHTVWQHLRSRDNWQKPNGASDDDAFLMVQVMETWFVADREALRSYFNGCLNEKALPQWPNLESVPKEMILKALDSATANCKTGYTKGRVSFQLLSSVNAAQVENRCQHARRLMERLRAL